MFQFNEYGRLLNECEVLAGKTIKSVIPGEVEDFKYPGDWVIEFTDGSKIGLVAHYDDSEVFWVKVGD